jgi:hypothetical protein
MAWSNTLTAKATMPTIIVGTGEALPSPFPFDANKYAPLVNTVPGVGKNHLEELAKNSEKSPEDSRNADRENIKSTLRSIMANRMFSENARVNACRELSNIVNNEEIAELHEEVKKLRAIIEANAPDESALPPFLRKRK